MKRTRITDTQHPLFAQAWSLYEHAFPANERRPFDLQRKVMMRPIYHFDIVTKNSVFVGIMLWWAFKDTRYVEHLATLPHLRGKGYGKHILETFIAESNMPVWLETEYPANEIKRRRIGFYQRLGFVLNDYHYMQPPYWDGGDPVPLLLMTYPDSVSKAAVGHFCMKYHPLLTDYA